MLETYNMNRGTGKTTEVIKKLEGDEDLFLIIPILSMKQFYPKHLHNRIFSHSDYISGKGRGHRFTRVILDEGFMYDKEKLAHLYYMFGYDRIHTISYGTV
jgi:hypothetical protein